MSRIEERRFATELGVMDARDLIRAKYPAMLTALTPAQVDQVQRQLDADIINATLDRQKEDHDRWSIVGRTKTGQPVRDPTKAAVPFKPRMAKIVLNDADTVIRVDFQKLLSRDTFVTLSDNPDEAMFLLQMRSGLSSNGVWLHFFINASQMARTLYTMNDHRRWFVQLWYGHANSRNEIKSATGQLTRQVLLAVPSLAAGYYDYVQNGPTLRFLDRAMDSVQSKIGLIRMLHDEWDPADDDIRTKLLEWGITQAGKMGGVDIKYPSKNIWNEPSQTLALARKSRAAGELTEATKLTAYAAFQAEWGARAVEEYANAINSTKGAVGFALKVLEVVAYLGYLADTILFVRGLGKFVIKRLASVGSSAAEQASKTVVSRQIPEPRPINHGPAAYGPTHLPGYQEEKMAYEKTIDRANATLDSTAPRIASNDRYVVAEWDKLVAKQKEVSEELRAYQKKHGTAWMPIKEFTELEDRVARKYGLQTLAEKMGRK